MTSAKKNFLFSEFPNLHKKRMRIVLTAHPESLCSRIIRVHRGGLSVE